MKYATLLAADYTIDAYVTAQEGAEVIFNNNNGPLSLVNRWAQIRVYNYNHQQPEQLRWSQEGRWSQRGQVKPR